MTETEGKWVVTLKYTDPNTGDVQSHPYGEHGRIRVLPSYYEAAAYQDRIKMLHGNLGPDFKIVIEPAAWYAVEIMTKEIENG